MSDNSLCDALLVPQVSSAGPRQLLVDSTEMARILGISGKGLWTYSSPRGPIPVIRIGRSVRYCPSDALEAVKRMQVAADQSAVDPSATLAD